MHSVSNFEVRQILYITFLVAIDSPNKKDSMQNMSKPKNKEITSLQKMSVLHNTLNFEVRQILWITFFVEINLYNKKIPYKVCSKLKIMTLQATETFNIHMRPDTTKGANFHKTSFRHWNFKHAYLTKEWSVFLKIWWHFWWMHSTLFHSLWYFLWFFLSDCCPVSIKGFLMKTAIVHI